MLIYNNKPITYNGLWLTVPQPDPYNPLGLPPYTIRLRFTDGTVPVFRKGSAVQVSSSPNVWDLTYENENWRELLIGFDYAMHFNLLEIIGANSTGVTNMSNLCMACEGLTTVALFDTSSVTNMSGMFYACRQLAEVPLFDTGSVTNMNQAFSNCSSLATVPLFDTSSVTSFRETFASTGITSVPLLDTSSATDMFYMFSGCLLLAEVPLFDTSSATYLNGMLQQCYSLRVLPQFDLSSCLRMGNMCYGCENIESGMLDMYRTASNLANVPTHEGCFAYAGTSTASGQAEREQIPTSWGGDMYG